MEAKPICIIYLPDSFTIGGGRRDAPTELMDALNGNYGDDKIVANDYWKDYYWFSFYDSDIQTPRFAVLNVKDFTEIKYNELKRVIDDAIEKQNIKNRTNPE